ncbi:MAG: EamA family transporter [Clostridiales bacterium]|nr:EamA family transporter [Candidatus Crickella merdequi]
MTVGTILTLLGASFWGFCAVVSKYLIVDKGLDTIWMTDFRMTAAGIILLAWAYMKSGSEIFRIWHSRESVRKLLFIAFIGFGACQVTYFLSIQYCNAGIATALQQTAPIFVLVLVVIKERRLPTITEAGVLTLVIFGSFLLATGGDLHALSIPALALVYGLLSAITCVVYIVKPAELIKDYGTFETIGWGLTAGGIAIMPLGRLWHISGVFDLGTWLGLAYIILLGAVAAFCCFLYGCSIVGPVKGSIYGLLEPVIAVFASLIFLGQDFSTADYCGIAAILGGIAWLTLSKK